MRGGHVRGGDTFMFYVGTYTVDGETLTANIDISRHSPPQGDWGHSLFGTDVLSAQFIGKIDGETIKATGTSVRSPGARLKTSFTLLTNK